jgi:hypothetical protein
MSIWNTLVRYSVEDTCAEYDYMCIYILKIITIIKVRCFCGINHVTCFIWCTPYLYIYFMSVSSWYWLIFFAFTPYFRVIRGEAANIIFIVVCLTQPGLRTHDIPHKYTTDRTLMDSKTISTINHWKQQHFHGVCRITVDIML